MAFQVWIVGRIGSAGVGLFQLTMSVSGLAIVFSISGIRFASTRLVSEEMGAGKHGGIGQVMGRCIGYSLFFGMTAMVILFSSSAPIGFLWIGDARTVRPLRLIALSLPFISASSVFSGYFTACGRVYKNALIQITEQLVRIGLVAFFLRYTPVGDIERACTAVVLAGAIAEVFSFSLTVILYFFDRRLHGLPGEVSEGLTGRMLGVALPLAISAYARSSLSTIEQLLVPRGLRLAGLTANAALAGYGVIQGMVFPIIFFPSSFLLALNEMLVPDLTDAQVSGKTEYISYAADSLIRNCLMFSFGAAALLFTFADRLSLTVYSSREAGQYIRFFALLTPVIYMDMVTDGMLKGLGQQLHSMAINIADAAISVTLVWILLPRLGLWGYMLIICFTECFNLTFSVRRLNELIDLKLSPGMVFPPLICALGAAQITQLAVSVAKLGVSVVSLILVILICLLIYLGLLKITGCISQGERGRSGNIKTQMS
jgi:stage V sporulation protein B